ncbi:MAG: endopeptidase La [Spirochaetaceae bacterium]|nr:MAG: endopeptidase La [Spirochaetaceae bacterium]
MSSPHAIIPADRILPAKLLVIPLSGKPIFPGIFTPMMVNSQEDIAVIEQSLAGDSMIGLTLLRDEETSNPGGEDLHAVGTVAKIMKKINLPDGGLNIFISTLKRFRIKKTLNHAHPIAVAVEYIEDSYDSASGDEIKALTRSLIGEMKQVSENNPLFSEEMRLNMVNIDHPGKIADFFSSILNVDRNDQQKILETADVKERMELVLVHIKREQELLRLQKKIQQQINAKIEKSQREYFLKEELKAIKQELGMPVDARSSDHQRFREAIDRLQLSPEVREQVELELDKFSLTEPSSPEFQVTRNYLETIVNLPWNDPRPEKIDIRRAERVLNADHYGLEDVKQRILEFLSVRRLKQDSRGSIICLVGPPGVGKTSVGRSIAKALGKQFFRFSVGGMRDEAEIKGHRRTYVGAMPGKIIQGLKSVRTRDPVFMIDEIDKLGVSFQGDPSSALLEVLDPEQNIEFRDHYLDLPFDISSIFFVTTANTLDSIPAPLRDRMEIIRLSGYIDEEKVAIARKYLIPKSLQRAGLGKRDVKYSKKCLLEIANGYAREAGVRNLEKALDRIHRKLAHRVVLEEQQPPFNVEIDQLEELLGRRTFRDDLEKRGTVAGTALGLAWTPYGGDVLVIEAVSNPGKEDFRITGQMGEVMQESARIAYTWVRHVAERFEIPAEYFEKRQIHLHIPAGATPKDGPSAGITMAASLLSLATGRRLRARLAMTGELSLVGTVLPIGGLKEKTIAARRHRIKEIIIPKENERDLDDIPQHIKRGVTFHPVRTMDEVVDKILQTR